MADSDSVVKEMGLTPAGFARTLPNAAGHWSVQQQGLSYRLSDTAAPGQSIEILLAEQPERCIASICLPVTRVELRFSGLSDAERLAFLQRFDLYFQKGGG